MPAREGTKTLREFRGGIGGVIMTRQQFYHSKLWRQARQQKLHKDMYTCHDCGGTAREVHHIIPLADDNIENYEISLNQDNLMSLCKECHSKRTAGNTGDLPAGYVFDEDGQAVPV